MLGGFRIVASVPVTDLDQAREFYSDKLGLKLVGDEEGESLHYEGGEGTFLEIFRTRAGVAAGHTEVGFEVDDIERVVAEMTAAGIEFEEYDLGEGMTTQGGILKTPGGNAAWFKDPEGNVLGLFESLTS